jgi:predicted AlkP superfamily phosphohydrolase/phosphomutase/tetratricopeptide (TPR) repeat protein
MRSERRRRLVHRHSLCDHAGMPQRLAKRLLILGWDAADWIMIDRLLAAGGMPHLRRLLDDGVRADLSTLEPCLSPLLWTSIATGKTPDKHGILNFVEADPASGRLRLASSTSRRTKAIWNILTQAGLRTHVVGWYASHPAEPIRGCCVSNLFCEGAPMHGGPWPLPDGAVHPPEMARRIDLVRTTPAAAIREMLPAFLPKGRGLDDGDDRPATLARLLASTLSVQNAAMAILEQDRRSGERWDCMMVFLDAIDTVGHHFMRYLPPRLPGVRDEEIAAYGSVMPNLYQFHDAMLGRLLEAAGDDTTVILLSDHGFYCDHRRPPALEVPDEARAELEAAWHRPFGILAMRGPGIVRGATVQRPGILDIAPTSLALLGVPPGADMDGRVLREVLSAGELPPPLLSWDLTEGEAGLHPADLRQDPTEAREAIRQLVDLGYLAALPEDAAAQLDLVDRETRFNHATVLVSTGRPEMAIPLLEGLVASRPEEARYAMALANANFRSRRFDAAAEAARARLRLDPHDAAAAVLLGAALAAGGRSAEAAAVLDERLAPHADRPELALSLGDLCAALGRLEEASRHYERAKDFDASNPAVHLGLARIDLAASRFEDAAEHALDAVERQHVLPEGHHLLGVALTWMQQFDHAIVAFDAAVAMHPGSLDSHRYLASIHRHRGNAAKARHHREIAERILADPGRSPADLDYLQREMPMGPQEWARSMGLDPPA